MKNIVKKLPLLLLALIGSIGALEAFITGFEVQCDTVYVRLVLTGMLLLFFVMSLLKKRYTIPVLAILAVTIVKRTYRYRELIANGFFHIENQIISVINKKYKLGLLKYVAEFDKEEAITAFVILCAVVLSAITALVCFYGVQTFALTVIYAAMTAGPIIAGGSPSVLSVLAVVAFFVLNNAYSSIPETVSDISSEENEGGITGKGNSYIAMFGFFGITFLAALVFSMVVINNVNIEKFEKNKQLKREELITYIKNISIEEVVEDTKDKLVDTLFSEDEKLINIVKQEDLTGGIGGGKLLRDGEISFSNETMLRITLPSNYEPFYLGGFFGVTYSENGWEELNKKQHQNYNEAIREHDVSGVISILESRLMNYGYSDTIEINKPSIIVDYIGEDTKQLVTNIYTTGRFSDMRMKYDTGYEPVGGEKDSYAFSFYQLDIDDIYNLSRNVTYAVNYTAYLYQNFEESYRNYVYRTYTDVPEGLERLKSEAEELYKDYAAGYKNSLGSFKANKLISILDITKEYIADHASYTLMPQKISDKESFVESFLYETHEGYCVHYATSAVLLLRCAGIPARYVEGYIVTESLKDGAITGGTIQSSKMVLGNTFKQNAVNEEKMTIEVRDTNAHAWIQVYLDGYGWIDYEMTEGYSDNGINHVITESIDTAEATPTPMPTITPTPLPTATPSVTPEAVEDEDMTKDEEGDDTIPSTGEGVTPAPGPVVKRPENIIVRAFKKFMAFMLKMAVYALGITGVILLRYIFAKRYQHFRLNSGNNILRMVYAYKRIIIILKAKGLYPKPAGEIYSVYAKRIEETTNLPQGLAEVFEILQKASFSEEPVEECEVFYVIEYYKKLRVQFYEKQNKYMYIFNRYIKTL